MSVPKSQRSESRMQFIETAESLYEYTMTREFGENNATLYSGGGGGTTSGGAKGGSGIVVIRNRRSA